MATLEARFLDAFPDWLRSLAEDARVLASVLETAEDGVLAQRSTAALNYLFKSLDLIPDGLEDLGFIDDAFVVRAAVESAKLADASLDRDASGTLTRLAEDAGLIREFLGSEYERLQKYVSGLQLATVRGRNVSTVLNEAEVRADFVREVREWADGYVAPAFTRDQRNLVKLRAFLLAKLPA